MLRSLKDCLDPYDEKMQGFLSTSPALRKFMKSEKESINKYIKRVEKLTGRDQVTKYNNPRLYSLFEDVYKKLNRYANSTLRRPRLYLAYDYYAGDNSNAYTYVDGNITITYDATTLPDEMVKSIIAHEFGHIIFRHADFSPLFEYIFSNSDDDRTPMDKAKEILGFAKRSSGDSDDFSKEEVELFIYNLSRWERFSEFTADNVACLYSGSSTPTIDCEMHFYNIKADAPFKFKKRNDFIGYCYAKIGVFGREYSELDYYKRKSHPNYIFRVANVYENMGGKPFITKKGADVFKQEFGFDSEEKETKSKPKKKEPASKRTVTFIYRFTKTGVFQRKKALFLIIDGEKYRIDPDHSITLKLKAEVESFVIHLEGDTTKYSADITGDRINIEYDPTYGAPIVLS